MDPTRKNHRMRSSKLPVYCRRLTSLSRPVSKNTNDEEQQPTSPQESSTNERLFWCGIAVRCGTVPGWVGAIAAGDPTQSTHVWGQSAFEIPFLAVWCCGRWFQRDAVYIWCAGGGAGKTDMGSHPIKNQWRRNGLGDKI
eukprot:CAMPEP_0171311034 /NCGR_PEP_ID=MMETSP0816-20121228/21258_1 /TAXON_ID=420281 /ORGANISM="Proboscia inermis, Strain CCAP1064/1" /LENGTH=139 /DNA_ID=CAMNT_0011795535 /DNA_START=157 /DNA_END=574 /DNA_ORIENTATION=+